MKKMVSAGIVLYRVNDQGTKEYLLLQYTAGHWDFAKGKIENNETLEQAALRELKEEAGISAVITPGFSDEISYYFTDYDGQKAFKIVHFFIGAAVAAQPIQLSHEHTDYVWLPFNEACQKLTYDNAKTVLTESKQFLDKE